MNKKWGATLLVAVTLWLAWSQVMEQQSTAENNLPSGFKNERKANSIQFSIQSSNSHISSTSVPITLNINSGAPAYKTILIDETNFAAAVWSVYDGKNLIVNLDQTEGWHEVWVGLRGYTDDYKNAKWEWNRFKLDFTPPQIVITNPIFSSVDKPSIQLQGFSPEALSHISYDLSNAAVKAVNQQVLITDEAYNTNIMEFTTNYFQAYDVPLTNGVNTITIRAADLAGNVTTTNFSFILDYSSKTNPPVVQLTWPQDGMEICGNDIVCRGRVNDDTALVNIQLVDAKGATNAVGSRVSRDGIFFSDNLTLADGTNYLNYAVTDAAGNTTTTNITVKTSDLGLTMAHVVAGQSLVTGTISDSSYTVLVNGVKATNDGNGKWSARIEPIGIHGGAVVVNAFKDGDDSGHK